MATIRTIPGKRGNTYNVQIRIRPYGNVTKTFKKWKAAQQWAANTEMEMREGTRLYGVVSESRKKTLSLAIERYRKYVLPSVKKSRREHIIDWWQKTRGYYGFKSVVGGLEFEFENDVSRSVALSAILTAVVRRSIAEPLHGFTAPKMASGKTLLADVASLIATGKSNACISHADNETEERKRLLAVLMTGDPIICYDNVEKPFGSPALCSVLTSTEFKDRILGETRSISVPTNCLFLATGNNLTFHGDLSTRAVVCCRIDPGVERPEERHFKRDLRKHIPEHRGRLVAAVLTILRAYYVAGRPKQDLKEFWAI